MAKLYFRIASDWEEVVRLRNEIEKLKNTLKTMNGAQSPRAFETLNNKLSEATNKMHSMVAEAAKAGAEIEGSFKKKIFDASQVVNGLSEKITLQRGVIQQLRNELSGLKDKYREAIKENGNTDELSSKIKNLNARLSNQKEVLFNLSQEHANAKLNVKRLRDEYELYEEKADDVVKANENIGTSWKKALAVIGGGAMVKGLISDMIRVRGEFQSMQTAFETMVGKDVAGQLIPQIKELAKISPLTMSDMVGAEKMMLGFNIQAEETIKYLKAISDISMGESSKFNSLTLAFSQMSAAGKLMGQDLNQMINAGFNPLQIIAEKTGKSIATLKDEMSKGAISAEMVQQAFISATSAGGKFYNMSENASKTINGQISMMHDAMDAAFNELGTKSEGVIIKGIQLTTSLVKNYETIGKVLVGLVATYGTYRTAVMLSTIATSKHALAEIALTNVRVLARKAQLALNASMLANPYVLLATVIGGLAATMWAFEDSATEAEKAQRRFNEQQEEAKKQEEEHKQKIDSLVRTSRDIALADLQRGQSLAELRKEYPKIFEKYDIETIKLADILKLKQLISEEDARRSKEKRNNDFKEANKAVLNYETKLNAKKINGGIPTRRELNKLEELRRFRDEFLIEDGKSISEQFISNLKNINISEFDRYISELEKRIKGLGENGRVKLRLPIDVKGSLSDEAIYNVKDIKTLIDTAKSTKKARIEAENNKTYYDKAYKEAKITWESAKKKLNEIKKDKGKFTKQEYIDAKKALDDAEKAFKDLGGITGSALAKQENKAKKEIKEQEKINEQILSLRRQNQQDKINIMKDGKEKELAQINLNYQKELDVIRRNEKKVAESQDGKLTSKQVVMFSQMRGIAKSKKQHDIDEVNEGEVEKYKKLLEKYQDYITKYSATKKKFDDDKKKMQEQGASEEQLNEVDYQRDLALESISEEFAMREDSFKSWMDSIANMSIEKLKEQLALAKTELENAERENPNDKGLAIQRAKVDKLEKAVSSNKIKRSTKDWQDLYRTLGKVDKELGEIGDSIGGVAGEAIKTAGSITTASLGMISGILEVSQSSSWAIDSTATTATNAIKMVENASVILAVISAALKIAMKIAELFSGKSSYEKYQEATEVYDAYIDTLDKVIDRRLKLAESLTGKDADVAYKEALELYKEQEEAARILGKQYLESRKKRNHSYGYKEVKNMSAAGWEQAANAMGVTIDKFKNMMGDRMTGLFDLSASELINLQEHARVFWAQLDDETRKYLDQIIEGVDATSEVVQQSLENFTGTSFDSFSDGILEQLYEVRTKSEDIFNDMSDNIRKSLIKAMYVKNIEPELKKWYDLWGNSIKDDGEIDETEREKLEEIKKNLVDSAISQVEEINKIWRDENSIEKQEASRGFGTEMTHEDAGELSGRFTAMHESNLRIEAENQRQTTALTELNNKMVAVVMMSGGMYNIADETRDLIANSYLELVQISENTGNSAKYLKLIQSDIAEVKNNTSKL